MPSCDERWLIQKWNFNWVYIGTLREKNGKKLLKGKTREFWTYYIVFLAKKHFFTQLLAGTGSSPAYAHAEVKTCWVFPHAAVSNWECYIVQIAMYSIFFAMQPWKTSFEKKFPTHWIKIVLLLFFLKKVLAKVFVVWKLISSTNH